MADDIILTEEEQVEQLKKWLKKNGPSIVFGVVIGLGLVFGYNFWQGQKQSTAEQASTLYHEITANAPDAAKLAETSQRFKDEYAKTPYAGKAALVHAKSLVEAGDLDGAATELNWAKDNALETVTQHVARLRLAAVLIEQNKLDQADQVLKVDDEGGFSSNYYELKGDVAAKQNSFEAAAQLYQQAIDASQDAAYTNILQLKLNNMTSLKNGQVVAPAPAEPVASEPATDSNTQEDTNTEQAAAESSATETPVATTGDSLEQDGTDAPATNSTSN